VEVISAPHYGGRLVQRQAVVEGTLCNSVAMELVGQEAQDNVCVLNYPFSKGLYALRFFSTVLAW
jgi:hypothetical protein